MVIITMIATARATVVIVILATNLDIRMDMIFLVIGMNTRNADSSTIIPGIIADLSIMVVIVSSASIPSLR